MPDEAPKIRPTASGRAGSFVSERTVKEGVDAFRAKQQMQEMKSAQDRARGEKEDEEEKARIKEIDDLLPERIAASFGTVTFSLFKQQYQEVWDQVANKDHLARGFCMLEAEISPGCAALLRTLKTREMRVVRRFTPASNPEDNFERYLEEEMIFRDVRVIASIQEFNKKQFPDLEYPLDMSKGDWLKTDLVSQRLEWLHGLPEEIVERLSGVVSDLVLAYRYALQENLKNRLAPLSPS